MKRRMEKMPIKHECIITDKYVMLAANEIGQRLYWNPNDDKYTMSSCTGEEDKVITKEEAGVFLNLVKKKVVSEKSILKTDILTLINKYDSIGNLRAIYRFIEGEIAEDMEDEDDGEDENW